MELKESDLRKEFLGTWIPRLVCAVEEISKHLKALNENKQEAENEDQME